MTSRFWFPACFAAVLTWLPTTCRDIGAADMSPASALQLKAKGSADLLLWRSPAALVGGLTLGGLTPQEKLWRVVESRKLKLTRTAIPGWSSTEQTVAELIDGRLYFANDVGDYAALLATDEDGHELRFRLVYQDHADDDARLAKTREGYVKTMMSLGSTEMQAREWFDKREHPPYVVKAYAGAPFSLIALESAPTVLRSKVTLNVLGSAAGLGKWSPRSARPPGQSQTDVGSGASSEPFITWEGMFPLRQIRLTTIEENQVLFTYFLGAIRGDLGNPPYFLLVKSQWTKPEMRNVASLKPAATIVVTDDSPVPFICDDEGMPEAPLANAVNVTLRFPAAGIRIPIGEKVYVSTSPGATIEFTASGPLLDQVVPSR